MRKRNPIENNLLEIKIYYQNIETKVVVTRLRNSMKFLSCFFFVHAGDSRAADGNHAQAGVLHPGVCFFHGEDSFQVSLLICLSIAHTKHTSVAFDVSLLGVKVMRAYHMYQINLTKQGIDI